ncbi:hypothetical protein HY389_02280 [Candidatus Daviesbacteria bacterium]|nr:hypothetical protein [Candidatus Daviesbacteria bacterium]
MVEAAQALKAYLVADPTKLQSFLDQYPQYYNILRQIPVGLEPFFKKNDFSLSCGLLTSEALDEGDLVVVTVHSSLPDELAFFKLGLFQDQNKHILRDYRLIFEASLASDVPSSAVNLR